MNNKRLMKVFSLFIIVALLLAALPLQAKVKAATTWTVCPDGCNYTKIQDAVTAASPGDIINVFPGRYVEDVTISTGNVTLQAATKHEAVIEGTVVVSADNVTVDGFSIMKFSLIIYPAEYSGVLIKAATGVKITNNLIDGIENASNYTLGIETMYADTASGVILNNEIKNVNMGIYIQSTGGGTFVIEGNTITNAAHSAIGVDQVQGMKIIDNEIGDSGIGLELMGSQDALVQGNAIIGSAGSGSNEGVGIWMTGNISGTTIQGNTITGNNTEDDETSGGIWVDEDVNGNEVSINFNKIVDNNRFGVINASTINTIDATNNWWGCNAGPGNSGCDTASENVDYDPWVVLKIISEKQIVEPNETIQIDANLIHNSDEENTLSDGYVPDGIEAEFVVQHGEEEDFLASETTVKGQVSTSFTPTEGGVYKVCVTVDNQTVCTEDIVVPAAAAVDDVYRMMFNSTLDVAIAEGVTKNDTGITDFAYVVSLVSGPTHGQLELKPDGSFKYIPEANFLGEDVFIYQLVIYPREPAPLNNQNPWTDQATVTISVEAYQIFMPLILK